VTGVLATLAAAGLVVSLVALGPWLTGPASPDASRAGSPAAPARSATGAGPIARTGTGLEDPPPVTPPTRVRLPGIDLSAPVRPVGVAADGQMELPRDPRVLGWYRFGAAPGSGEGAVVLAGHLDSVRFGLGPLVRLRDAEVGQAVLVRVAGRERLEYAVSAVRRFDRQALPSRLFARGGPERLHLITCGGAYLPDAGGYQQNLVVTARPVSSE
jgi:hypothetical protein